MAAPRAVAGARDMMGAAEMGLLLAAVAVVVTKVEETMADA